MDNTLSNIVQKKWHLLRVKLLHLLASLVLQRTVLSRHTNMHEMGTVVRSHIAYAKSKASRRLCNTLSFVSAEIQDRLLIVVLHEAPSKCQH